MPVTPQRCQLSGGFSASFLPSDIDNAVQRITNINIQYGFNFSFGTGSGQVNQMYVKTNSVAASAHSNLDLAGTLLNAYGEVITLAFVKAIVMENRSAAAATIFLFGNTGGTWPTPLPLTPVGAQMPYIWAEPHVGIAVTPGTADILRITNADAVNAGVYQIVLLGTQV